MARRKIEPTRLGNARPAAARQPQVPQPKPPTQPQQPRTLSEVFDARARQLAAEHAKYEAVYARLADKVQRGLPLEEEDVALVFNTFGQAIDVLGTAIQLQGQMKDAMQVQQAIRQQTQLPAQRVDARARARADSASSPALPSPRAVGSPDGIYKQYLHLITAALRSNTVERVRLAIKDGKSVGEMTVRSSAVVKLAGVLDTAASLLQRGVMVQPNVLPDPSPSGDKELYAHLLKGANDLRASMPQVAQAFNQHARKVATDMQKLVAKLPDMKLLRQNTQVTLPMNQLAAGVDLLEDAGTVLTLLTTTSIERKWQLMQKLVRMEAGIGRVGKAQKLKQRAAELVKAIRKLDPTMPLDRLRMLRDNEEWDTLADILKKLNRCPGRRLIVDLQTWEIECTTGPRSYIILPDEDMPEEEEEEQQVPAGIVGRLQQMVRNQKYAARAARCPKGHVRDAMTGKCIKRDILQGPTYVPMRPAVGVAAAGPKRIRKLKDCPEGYERNPVTRRCNKIGNPPRIRKQQPAVAPVPVAYAAQVSLPGSPVALIPSPAVVDVVNAAVQQPAAPKRKRNRKLKDCPEGYERNPVTRRCKKVTP